VLIFVLLNNTPPVCSALSADEPQPALNERGYTSSRVCGSCHEDIYNTWKRSLHALSLDDPVFDVAFMQALKTDAARAKRLCYRCHAPMVIESNDYELRESVTAEGVGCDFCHSVTEVVLNDREKPYRSEVGRVKRSILRKAKSPAHEVAYSELHGRAEFCGGCHQYVTENGTIIMGTYQDWLDSQYARDDVPCQECHMARSVGHRVRSDIKQTDPSFPLHDLIHNTDQVKGAVSVEVAEVTTAGSHLIVHVDITNSGSGHMVPTGIPTRELRLVVRVTDESDKTTETQRRSYAKVIGGRDGRELRTDMEVLMSGERILSDNRIAPKEKRREVFRFPARSRGPFQVSAEVVYGYRPYVLDLRVIEISMDKASRIFSP